jgi:HlyD family secretion protein
MLRRWFIGALILLVFTSLAIAVPSFMEATVDPEDYRIGRVTRGDIITSLSTEGKVEPLYQEVITSPVATRVEAINYQPGDTVDPSTSIIRLDLTDLHRNYQRVRHEVALKKNSTARKKEELQHKRRELQTTLKSDSLQTARLKAYFENEKKLLDIGGTSRENVEKARIDYQISKLDQQKLQDEYESFKEMNRLDIASLNLEMEMKQQEMTEMQELLERAGIRPTREGIVTRIGVTPGETVGSGQAVARVSGLDQYIIHGKIPDRYVDRVYSTQPVQVLIDDTTLRGRLSSLSPGVDHGDINYTVRLSSSNYHGLRSKKQVELRLINQHVHDTLRLPNAGYYDGEGNTELYVIQGNQLIKRQVKLGACSYDHVVVLGGLQQGDRVILSRDFYRVYGRHSSVKIKK